MSRDDVEAAWKEFKRDILKVIEAVCGRMRHRKEVNQMVEQRG